MKYDYTDKKAGARYLQLLDEGWNRTDAEIEAYGNVKLPPTRTPEDEFILDQQNPLDTAKRFRLLFYSSIKGPTLYCIGGTPYAHSGTAYQEVTGEALRAQLYRYCEVAKREVTKGKEIVTEPFKPKAHDISNIIDALKSHCYLAADFPAWIDPEDNLPDPRDILPARNGLIHLTPTGPVFICKPTPRFLSTNALDYDFIPDAPQPVEWLKFLLQIWPDDEQAIDLLCEWFGYCLGLDTRQQKMLLLVGPMRSGKGTVARILTAMIGAANVCGPTLCGLATNFGLWALIGKQLAIISDARLSGRIDQSIVTERLLAISGGDAITIDRKNLQPVTLTLPVRFMVLSNELPRLSDASGALANRFLILTLKESFLGREDTGLLERILPELPGILAWSIKGWQRLRARGHFVQPNSSRDAIQEMLDLSSVVNAFTRECCKIGSGLSVAVSDLYESFAIWSKEQGTTRPADKQIFGRDLRAAFPGLTIYQPCQGGQRFRAYRGIDLTLAARQTLTAAQAARQPHEGNDYAGY